MLVGLVKFPQGVEQQIDRTPMHGSMVRGRAYYEFIDAGPRLVAILDDLHDSFLTSQLAVFGMMNFTRFKEQDGVGFTGVHVQGACLSRLVEHLYEARQINMRKASAERRVC